MNNLSCRRSKRIPLPAGALGVTLNSDESQAFAACLDGVYSINVDTEETQLLYGHGSYASNIVYLPHANQVVSSGYDGAIRWYDVASESVARTVPAHRFWSWDLALSADSRVLASSTGQYLAGDYEYHPLPADEPCIRVFDASEGRLLRSFDFGPPTQAVAVTDDGRHVAAANLMGDIAVWEIDGEQVAAGSTPDFTAFGIIKSHCQIGGIYAIHFIPGTTELLVAGMGPMRDPMAGNGKQRWQRFDWSSSDLKKTGQSKDDQVGEGLMETLAISPNRDTFVMGGRLRGGSWSTALFDLNTGDLVTSMKTDSRVTKAVFSSSGEKLFLAGAKKQKKESDKQFGVLDIYELTKTPAESTDEQVLTQPS